MVSKAQRKYWRTSILGILAMGGLIWAAMDQFDIPVDEMLDLFYTTLLVVGTIILGACLIALIWVGVRFLFRSKPR